MGIEWDLFIDESGKFDKPSDDVVVAGVLLRAGSAWAREETVRDALRNLLPGFPWPWHTRLFVNPACLALASLANRVLALAEAVDDPASGIVESIDHGDRTGLLDRLKAAERGFLRNHGVSCGARAAALADALMRVPPAEPDAQRFDLPTCVDLAVHLGDRLDRAADGVVALLMTGEANRSLRALRALLAREEPAKEDADQLGRLLGRPAHSKLRRPLEDHLGAIHAGFRSLNGLLAKEGVALLAICGETSRHSWRPPENEDRYLSLLYALVVRACHVIREREKEGATLRLRVLRRDVRPNGYAGSIPLDVPRLEKLVGPLVAAMAPSVELRCVETPRWSEAGHGAYVLADYAAARGCREFGNRRLSDLEDRLVSRLGMRVSSGAPERTHVAAVGLAWAWREDEEALRKEMDRIMGGPVEGETDVPRPWALEQALEWIP